VGVPTTSATPDEGGPASCLGCAGLDVDVLKRLLLFAAVHTIQYRHCASLCFHTQDLLQQHFASGQVPDCDYLGVAVHISQPQGVQPAVAEQQVVDSSHLCFMRTRDAEHCNLKGSVTCHADEVAGKTTLRKQWVFLADASASAGVVHSAAGAGGARPSSANDGNGAAVAEDAPADPPSRPWLLAVQLHAEPEALQFLDPARHIGGVVAMRDLRLKQARPGLRLWDADATEVRPASQAPGLLHTTLSATVPKPCARPTCRLLLAISQDLAMAWHCAAGGDRPGDGRQATERGGGCNAKVGSGSQSCPPALARRDQDGGPSVGMMTHCIKP
jgi:hypothetical protein